MPESRFESSLRGQLRQRQAQHLHRALRQVPGDVIDLASNDYLGLARHPAVVEAACAAVQCHGASARASRLISGHTALHAQLESRLAAFKGCEAALVFPSGYHANLSVVATLARAGDVLLCDKRNHASLVDACRLAQAGGATVRYYGSLHKLRVLLKARSVARRGRGDARTFIVSDAVYSMDGDVADLPSLIALAAEFEATVILDDAHGIGTLGARGRGAMEHFGWHARKNEGTAFLPPTALIQIGTLSKALGSQGGFVAGSRTVIDWLVNMARPFIYTTALNPASCGAALAALAIVEREPHHLARLREMTSRLAAGLQRLGFDARLQPSPIIPVIAGDAAQALAWSEALLEYGVWCPAIRPPTVPVGTSRLRATASMALEEDDVERILAAFAQVRRQYS
jgi:8-amino-7-oxononanoate synthase